MIAQNTEIHVIQRSFRQVMDAFARPGMLRAVEELDCRAAPEGDLSAYAKTLVRMFIDQAVTFSVVGPCADGIVPWIVSETHSKHAPVDTAHFVLVPRCASTEDCRHAVSAAYGGDFVTPEQGATVIVECARLDEAPFEGGFAFAVSGPGVEDVHRFAADRGDWLQARTVRGDEYPCGIELVLVDASGAIVAIPRTSKVVVEEVR